MYSQFQVLKGSNDFKFREGAMLKSKHRHLTGVLNLKQNDYFLCADIKALKSAKARSIKTTWRIIPGLNQE
jgi:hypothetical protein